MKRFTIKLVASERHPKTALVREAWSIIDSAARDFNMPERACAVNLHSKYNAQIICDILNTEWARFCAEPW